MEIRPEHLGARRVVLNERWEVWMVSRGKTIVIDTMPVDEHGKPDPRRVHDHAISPFYRVSPPTFLEKLRGITHEKKVRDAIAKCREWVADGASRDVLDNVVLAELSVPPLGGADN